MIDIPTSSGRQVLIVEDEPRLREMLARGVRDMGFNPVVAPTAEAGIRKLAHLSADIILLDLNLPGMDGLSLLRRLQEQSPDVKVIVLTGFGSLEAAQKAIHYGVVEFLTKPCPLGTLESALNRARLLRTPSLPEVRRMDESDELELAPLGQSLEDVERKTILTTLARLGGNRAATAVELGISERKLYYRLEQYQKSDAVDRDVC